MNRRSWRWLLYLCLLSLASMAQDNSRFQPVQADTLWVPETETGAPAPGKRVKITPKEYRGTNVYHTLYLPKNWDKNWKEKGLRYPVIFEYTRLSQKLNGKMINLQIECCSPK